MKNNDDDRLLANKRRIDAERRAQAIHRDKQSRLGDMTPGVATPLTVKTRVDLDRLRKQINGGTR